MGETAQRQLNAGSFSELYVQSYLQLIDMSCPRVDVILPLSM